MISKKLPQNLLLQSLKFTTSEEVRILKVMELILQKLDVVDVKHDFMINEKFQMSVYELNQLVNDF